MPRSWRMSRIAGWLLTALGGAGVLLVSSLMAPSSSALVGESACGKAMTDLQIAFTAARAERILDDWAGEPPASCRPADSAARTHRPLLEEARRNLAYDAWLVPCYVSLLAGPWLLLGGATGNWRRSAWLVWALAAVIAGACDYGENALLLREIDRVEAGASLPGWLPLLAGLAAGVKFVLLAVVAVALLVIGIVVLRASLAGAFRKLPPREWLSFDEVLAREADYLASRRCRAHDDAVEEAREAAAETGDPPSRDLGAPRLAGRPIGLAFSGGGIRAATTCLGALQTLCRRRLLPWVDYLSTVSGGGYLGSALSSLLSINRRKVSASALGLDDQYLFTATDRPYLTTRVKRFPFESRRDLQEPLHEELRGRFDGRVQLEHLRTHGDFLIRTKRLFHRDVLRALGTVFGGIFYHLLLGLLVLVAIAGGYLAVLYLMAGPIPAAGFSSLVGEPEVGTYWRLLFTFRAGGVESAGPFLSAVGVGVVMLTLTMILCSLIWSLPEAWFRRVGDSPEENREYHSLWALFFITLTIAVLVTKGVVVRDGWQLANITLPMGVYIGGWLASLALHWVVSTRSFNRNQRSRFAAWKGILDYLTVVSVLVILVPFALAWINKGDEWPVKEALAWLGSLAGSGWLAKSALGKGGEGAAEKVKLLQRLPEILRNLVLGVLVTVVVVLGLLLVAALILRLEAAAPLGPLAFRLSILGAALGIFALLGLATDFNKLSLHFFYRDRLVETYLQTLGPVLRGADSAEVPGSLDLLRDNGEMRLVELHGSHQDPAAASRPLRRSKAAPAEQEARPAPAAYVARALPRALGPGERIIQALPFAPPARADEELAPVQAVTGAPLHLIVTCLNLTRSRDMTRRSRKSDSFVFSKLFCGSDTTGYMDTRHYRSGETKLARALTVSGAAADSAMGFRTFFAQALAMTLFNVRLGQWIENPRYRNGARAFRREGWVFWPFYLLQELLGASDASHRLVHISDGGHTGDNLGIYPLLQRRCRLIVACDAERDLELGFGSFNEAVRQVEIDLGIKIDIDLGCLRPDKATGLSSRSFALGRITYPKDSERQLAAGTGWLLLVKSSLCGCESEPILNYKKRHPDFPHQSTADLFYDDAQFEAYRALGASMMDRALGAELWEVLRSRPRWLRDWREEMGDVLPPAHGFGQA